MLIRTHNPHKVAQAAERKGVILLVVISLLTLFAIVGLSFVLYANAEANASKIYREAANQNQIDMEPELLFNMFLGQLIYDVNDDYTGVYSAMRGYSLGRGICGLNYNGSPGNITLENFAGPTSTTPPPGTPLGPLNAVPFNGTGRLHSPSPTVHGLLTFADDYQIINYTFYPGYPGFPGDGFLRDPERLGDRPNLTGTPGTYAGGFNAPYTYPDLNSMFLAAVKADGTVLMPSFHRHWLFNPSNLLNDPSNPNWGDPRFNGLPNPLPIGPPIPAQATGKYLSLRPRPVDQLLPDPNNRGFFEQFPPNRPFFDYPEDPGGDVKNLPGPGYLYKDPTSGNLTYANNDSVWMDLGAPVMTAPNGTKFKALFAPLILDLDGRINLNVAGNVRGWEPNMTASGNPPHVSNQGWGPWEMNLGYVLPQPNASGAPEWAGLFLGNGPYQGRYGQDLQPSASGTSAQQGTTPHFYGQVDFDGCNEQNGYSTSGPISLPPANSFTSFPFYTSLPPGLTPQGWGNGTGGAPGTERWNHPLLYNYFQPAGDDRVFGISNMEALLRYGDTNSPFLTSDLFRLCPNNFQNARMRNLVTTISYDVDQPGLSPWAVPPQAGGAPGTANYTLQPGILAPSGPATSFPPLTNRTSPQSNSGEFSGLDWRAINAGLGRINLNRNLTPYTATTIAQADTDRQQFAADIFIRLVAATGAYDLFNPTPPPITVQAQFDALRWLAQLSANIVDYIDSDDVMTTFNWTMPYNPAAAPGYVNNAYKNYPAQIQNAIAQFQTALGPPPGGISADPIGQGWVFGTELPRLVINEVYGQFKTTPPSTMGKPPAPPPPYTVQVDLWVELMNPFNAEIPGADPANGAATLYNPTTGVSIYQMKLVDTNSGNLRQNGNVNGDIIMSAGDTVYTQPTSPPAPSGNGGPCVLQFPATVTIGGTPTPIPPVYGIGQTAPPAASAGFFVVGSSATPPTSITINPNSSYIPTAGTGNPNPMSYQLPGVPTPPYPPPPPTILLQRLINPYAPPNPAPGQPGNNPALAPNVYVTVDYMEGGNLPPRPNPVLWSLADTSTAPAAGGPSFGRGQPYAGAKNQIQQQTGSSGSNTFYAPNNSVPPAPPPVNPYNWLTHLDRQLVSPMELLNVSAFKPHELTQQFNAQAYPTQMLIPNPPMPGTTPCFYGHRAPWFDEDVVGTTNSHLLYRLFEFLETGNRASGLAPGGRIPAKVNINTLYDEETLQAICAALAAGTPSPNCFDTNTIHTVFSDPNNGLLKLRSPGLVPGGGAGADGTLHATVNSGITPPGGLSPDQPFLSLATGLSAGAAAMPIPDQQYPSGLNINNTLMRGPAGTTSQPMFQATNFGAGPISAPHPYLQDQLLSKIFNNITTRSNVFAVWVTVGFFEVIQDTDPATGTPVRPVKLGAEIGKAENRHIRHRMFAIVDRSSLTTERYNPKLVLPPPVYLNASTYTPNPPPPAAATSASITIQEGQFTPGDPVTGFGAKLAGFYEGLPWSIQSYQPAPPGGFPILGTNLLIDTGPSQELVNVLSMMQPTGTAPTVINISGNPNLMAHSSPIAAIPVNTFTAYTPITAGSGATPIAISGVNGLQAPTGSQPGTTVLIDFGAGQEPATVQAISQPSAPGQPWTVVVQAANATGQFAFNHNPGAPGGYTVSYPIPTPGNPGPQPNFNMRQVPWVVRYFSIIN
jgi:hypothetical protein